MTTEKLPKVAKEGPYSMEMEPGIYSWCSCGLSQTQPFCDGSHQGTGFAPIVVTLEEKKKVGWCGCKMSAKGHICDGAHKCLKPPAA